MKKFLLLGLVAILLAACGGKSAETPSSGMDVSDPALPIEVTAGSEFKIVIDTNPSTGYHWEVAGELEPSIVEVVSREYRPGEPVMPGSGGKEVWVFKAVAAGETKITLGYYPPSNTPVDPEQTVTFTVIVK